MGIETAILIGITAFKVDQKMREGKRQAAAVVEKANLESANQSKTIQRRAAKTKVSFLNSGLEVSGSVALGLDGIFDAGLEDLRRTADTANKNAKNILSSARSAALMKIAGMGATLIGGGISGGITGSSTGSAAPAFTPINSSAGSFGSVAIGGSAPSSAPISLNSFRGL